MRYDSLSRYKERPDDIYILNQSIDDFNCVDISIQKYKISAGVGGSRVSRSAEQRGHESTA